MYEIFLKLLLANGMKPVEFSRATGISEATLSTWKRRGTIGKDGCKKIADYFGVSPDYVMFGENAATESDKLNELRPCVKSMIIAANGVPDEDIQRVTDQLKRLQEYWHKLNKLRADMENGNV